MVTLLKTFFVFIIALSLLVSSFVVFPYTLSVKAEASAETHYYLAPWEWVTEGGFSFWRVPQADKLLGAVDLRSLPAQGRAGGVPEGYGFFSYSQQVAIPDSIYLGDSLDTIVSNLKKAQVRTALNITGSFQSDTVRDILWDIVTVHSDPTGETAVMPLMPTGRLELELYLGGSSFVKREAFDIGTHPHKDKVLAVIRNEYRNIRENDISFGSSHYLKVLGAWKEQYKVADESIFIPADLPKERAEAPSTTIGDTFEEASDTDLSLHTATGPNGGFTWTELQGDIDVFGASDKAGETAGNAATARANFDLSSDNHYAQAAMETSSSTGTQEASVFTRKDATTTMTFYEAQARFRSDEIYHRVFSNGVSTHMSGSPISYTFNDNTQYLIKHVSDGSTQTVYVNGVSVHAVTDTGIINNLRTGIRARTVNLLVDNFEAGDSNPTPIIVAPPNATAPLRSNTQPTGELALGTTSATISLTTDENATCRYATTTGTTYGLMNNAFLTTGATNHSTSVSGLSDGTTYNYYVKCQDPDGNANTDDFVITFSVASSLSANITTVTNTKAVPTFKSIGIYISFTDNNNNSKADLEWRQAGEGTWKPGHRLSMDWTRKEARGSLVGLTPNTNYEIRVTFSDPDGVGGTNPSTLSVATRNEAIPFGTGTPYYVATTGNDANAGTEAQPFRMIQKALNTVQAGGTVYIKNGTYQEALTMKTSGTADNYITITNYQNDSAIIDGNNGAIGRLLDVDGADYIRIEGLTFQNSGGDLIRFVNGADYNVVENSSLIEPFYGVTAKEQFKFGDFGGAIHLRESSKYTVIRNNTINRNTPMTGKLDIKGVAYWRGGEGAIIYNNTFSGGFEDSFGGGPEDIAETPTTIDIDIYDNVVDSACFDDGFQVEGPAMNVRVWGNEVRGCFISSAYAPLLKGPAYYFRNIIYDNAHQNRGASAWFKLGDGAVGDMFVYNNTYVANAVADGFKRTNSPDPKNITSKNNIVRAGRYVVEDIVCSEADFDYDVLYTTDATRFISCSPNSVKKSFNAFQTEYGHELNGLKFDPIDEFVDPASKNFRLKSTSMLIDKGVIIPGFNDPNSSWAYKGTSPDIGAFEFDLGAPMPDTTSPSVPGNLSATAISSTQVNLTWNASADNMGVTGYKIYRNSAQIATSAAASYNNTGLTASTAYTYTVSAYDAAGNNSAQSASVSATTLVSFSNLPVLSSLDRLVLYQDRSFQPLQFGGSNFTAETTYRVKITQGGVEKTAIDLQRQDDTILTATITPTHIGSLSSGLYGIALLRLSDSYTSTFSKQLLITKLGDIWSSSAPPASEIKGDGRIDINDVSRLFSKWNSAKVEDLAEVDISSGPANVSINKVDIYDANKMMANWSL